MKSRSHAALFGVYSPHILMITIIVFFFFFVSSNICHGSDAVESAQKEIALWFKPEELVDWTANNSAWIYE